MESYWEGGSSTIPPTSLMTRLDFSFSATIGFCAGGNILIFAVKACIIATTNGQIAVTGSGGGQIGGSPLGLQMGPMVSTGADAYDQEGGFVGLGAQFRPGGPASADRRPPV